MSRRFSILLPVILSAVMAGVVVDSAAAADAQPTAIADLKHDGPVDFQKEVLPILKRNCTACHNASKKEGDLVLESPAAILKGGSSGPGAEAKKGAESLIVTRAAAADDEQMPPADNKVGAKRLTSTELGLIKLWIDQGAQGAVSATAEKIDWQPLPAGVQPVYAIALTPDGQYAAVGRANQIFIYHVPTGRTVGRLTDPAILKSGIYSKPGVADLDLIQSLAFSPDGNTLASGGFRTIKLWQRPRDVKQPLLGGPVAAAPTALATTADGKTAAVAVGNDVLLVNLADGKVTAKAAGHKAPVLALSFSVDGTKLATAGGDKTARLWNTADAKPLAQIDLPVDLTSVAAVADGMQIAVGAADGKIRLFTVKAGDPKPTAVREWATAGKKVKALAIVTSTPTQIVAGDEVGNVAIWNSADGKQVRAMQRTGNDVVALAVRADGQRIAAVGADKVLRLFNAADGKQLAENKGDVRAYRRASDVERAVNLAKGVVAAETAAIAEAEKNAKAETDAVKKAEETKVAAEKTLKEKTDAATKAAGEKAAAEKALAEANAAKTKADADKAAADKAIADADAAEKAAVAKANEAKAAAAKDAKNKALADAAAAAAKLATDASTKTKAARTAQGPLTTAAAQATQKATTAMNMVTSKTKPAEDAEKAKQDAMAVKVSAERAIAAAQASAKKAADAVPAAQKRKTDAEAKQKAAEAELATAQKAAADSLTGFRSIAFSADGKLLVAGADDKLVHTYDAEAGTALDVAIGHADAVVAVAVAGDRVISASADKTLTAWTLYPEWTWVRTIGDPASETLVDRVTALDFSRDGKLLASGGGSPSRSGEVKLWNVADGALVREVTDAHSDVVFGVRFSPDGTVLATCAADKFLKTFEVATGKFIRGYEGHTHHVLGVAWSADGKTLASAGADAVVKVWEVATGEQKRTVTGFGKEVTAITFAGEAQNCVAASGDKTVRLLRADNGQTAKTFAGAADFVYTCAVTVDGKIVAAGGQDGIVRVWNADSGAELKNFAPPQEATTEQASR